MKERLRKKAFMGVRHLAACTVPIGAAMVLSLAGLADSFIVPVRAAHLPQGIMSSPGRGNTAAGAEEFCHAFSSRGGAARNVGNGAGKTASSLQEASASAVGGNVVDALGANEGILNEEQRGMAATLLELHQVLPPWCC